MHITGAEQFWVGELLGKRTINRDRDAEFQFVAEDAVALRQRVMETNTMIREVLETVDPARLDASVELRGNSLTLRWGRYPYD